MRWLWILFVVGCASSNATKGPDCDPTVMTCDVVDAPPIPTEPDADLNDFGEPCVDNAQCDSHLCILVGTSGQCTQLCGECPAGYGCLGVEGISIEGQVSFVCVPISNQLCTPCVQDSECTLIGMDKCVTYADGDRACARDCSNITCPMGYGCEDVSIGGTHFKQCMATSGACDCTATNPGAMQPCNIPTPWNVCLGSQTCAGANGWGTCQPPSATDDPDGTYTDNNCDGIDGDYTKGIFVAGGGSNTATCGLTHTTPCQTVSFGIIRAVQAAKQHVYVQAGTYNEVVVLQSGVNVWGGYDFNWQRGPTSNAAHRVTIVGTVDTGIGGDGEWLTVRAHSLIVPVTLGDLVIRGPNAMGVGGASGRDGMSSYAVHIAGANLTMTRVEIQAGNGTSGGTGGDGTDAVLVDAQSFMAGGAGGNGDEFTTACNDSSRGAGGGRGTNTCSQSPSSRNMNGGAGGAGGTMDDDCSFPPSFNAQSGIGGTGAGFLSGAFGQPGGAGGTCAAGGGGNGGTIGNGAAGTAGAGGYITGSSGGYWYARGGNAGGTGENGSGGGGGGGAGGCDDGTDSYGAGGGGGAAGGCAARGGGTGGGGGGGSFGVYASGNAVVTISGCSLTRGAGGTGGAGGRGGRGQSGGAGGPIGSHPGGGAGGTGGTGAHGGHGGGGSGGTGGRSVGILSTPGTTVTHDCAISGGIAGGGGTGGLSAPFAPLAERDGNDGPTGSGGTLDVTRACPSGTSC